MSMQYPPKTVLAALKTFEIRLSVDEMCEPTTLTEALDQEELMNCVARKLKDAGYQVITDGGSVNAVLSLEVNLVLVTSVSNGTPHSATYSVRGEILTEVFFAHQPVLAIVADTAFTGFVEALHLSRYVTHSCGLVGDYMVGLLKGK